MDLKDAELLASNVIQKDAALSSRELRVIEVFTARRGAAVAKVASSGVEYALKMALPENDGPYDQHLLLKREGSILSLIDGSVSALYQAHGEMDDTSWMLSLWASYPTASDVAKEIGDNHLEFTRLCLALSKCVGRVHELGYLHGDLQPGHFLVTSENKAILIDWGLAHEPEKRDFEFKGAFVHYAAPEVARGMLNQEQHIQYGFASEVYALAAVIFFLYTGKTAPYYGSYDYKSVSFQEKLTRVSNGILHESFSMAESKPFPALEKLLYQCLDKNSDARPNIDEVIHSLKEIENDLQDK